jgi:NADPH2:quinone reductase
MNEAIWIHTCGGPEQMRIGPHEPGLPGPGQVLVRHKAIGVNFIDVYHRNGYYPLPGLPAILGMEGAGVVEAVGEEVTDVAPGDRVAYAGLPVGAYCTLRTLPAHRLVSLPEAISFEQAAAAMLKGMTARYLLHGCYPVKAGDTILVHAAAGGVGQILCQWASHIGAVVIGTVGSPDKARIAEASGCRHPIRYDTENWLDRVRQITGGAGVDVVYDGVGQSTFATSLDCLRPMGTMVSFGQSSGPVAPLDVGLLSAKGSLFLTRPSLMTYTARRADLLAHARDLFAVIGKGAVAIAINQTYPLRDAARAHSDLEARRTSGSTLLIP